MNPVYKRSIKAALIIGLLPSIFLFVCALNSISYGITVFHILNFFWWIIVLGSALIYAFVRVRIGKARLGRPTHDGLYVASFIVSVLILYMVIVFFFGPSQWWTNR